MSFTSVLPTPQIILKAKPAPPTDTAKGIDTLVSLTVYAAPKDMARGAEALSALSASIPPQLDTAKVADLPALAGPSLYGYILRLVKKGDIILPDDQNNIVNAWKAKLDKLSEIESKLRTFDPSLADTLAAYISELKSIVDSMPLVKEGDWVYSDHFNLHLRALQQLIEIEELLTTKICLPTSDMEQLLATVKNYAGQLSEKKTGDIVASADWNILKQALSVAHSLDERVSARIIPYTPSCLDPNDPTWAPSDGWTYVYNFASADELKQAFNDLTGYEVVENGVLKWNLPPDTDVETRRWIYDQTWRRMAVCLKMSIKKMWYIATTFLYLRSYMYPDRCIDVDYSINMTEWTPVIRVFGTGLPQEYYFPPPDDWFVIVIDNTPGQTPYLRIYDRSKNLLLDITLTFASCFTMYEMITFHPMNLTNIIIADIQVDWLALKY